MASDADITPLSRTRGAAGMLSGYGEGAAGMLSRSRDGAVGIISNPTGGMIAILPTTEPGDVTASSSNGLEESTRTQTALTTDYGGVTGVRSVVETSWTVVLTVTTSYTEGGQITEAPVPTTTVLQPGTVVINQVDPPSDKGSTNLVAILAGTLGCVGGIVLVGVIIYLTRRARKRPQRHQTEEDSGGVAYPNRFDKSKTPIKPDNTTIGDGLVATPFDFAPDLSIARQHAESVQTTMDQCVDCGTSPTLQNITGPPQPSLQEFSNSHGDCSHRSQANEKHFRDNELPVQGLSAVTRTMEEGPPPYSG